LAADVRLASQGYAILTADETRAVLAPLIDDVPARAALASTWNDLPRDTFLADGGRYRYRRHASHILDAPASTQACLKDVPYRPHWQPKAYNRLHGGMLRTFAEVAAETRKNALYRGVILRFGDLFARSTWAHRGHVVERWFVEAHQFRIDARHGEGRPTPEGAHRDGVDFVLLLLLGRKDITGASTTIYDNAGAPLCVFTLTESWSAMLLDDTRVIHGTTPFRATGAEPERDTLVVTYRAGGFLDPGS